LGPTILSQFCARRHRPESACGCRGRGQPSRSARPLSSARKNVAALRALSLCAAGPT